MADALDMTQDPGSRPRQAGDSPKSLRTRARILDTAMQLFVQMGYHPATNAVIADAAVSMALRGVSA